MAGIFPRRWKFGHRHAQRDDNMKTQREDNYVKIVAETGVFLPRAKGHPELPEASRGKEGSLSRGFRGSIALPVP